MKVRQLVQHLVTLDMDAEVMVDAPLSCARSDVAQHGGNLTLPVLAVTFGVFQSGNAKGRPWVSIVGTDIWGLDLGIRKASA